jgi:hypothetical protein
MTTVTGGFARGENVDISGAHELDRDRPVIVYCNDYQ